MPAEGEAGTGAGLLVSLRRLGGTVVAALATRLELLSTESEEQIVRLTRVWLLAAAAFLLFTLGLLVATAFVLILFWDTHRLAAAGLLALAYLAAGAALAIRARREARLRPRLFAATLGELGKDRDQLRGLM